MFRQQLKALWGQILDIHLLLELNLMKKAWKSYGVDMILKASGLRNVINHGTKVHDDTRKVRRVSK